MKNRLTFIVVCIFFLASCNDEVSKTVGPKPSAMGIMNDVEVITDKDDWNGMVGDTFKYYFSSAYPIMPTPEPFFDLRHFTAEQLSAEQLRRTLRTYVVLADLSDTESEVTKMVKKDFGEERFLKAQRDKSIVTSVGKDKWAKNQIVIYVLGRTEQELVENIKGNFSAIAKRIQMHDKTQIEAKIYVKPVNKGLSNNVQNRFNIDLKVPGDYRVVKDEETFLWIRRDLKEVVQNISIQKIPYTNEEQLTKENIKDLTNAFGLNVHTDVENSIMVVNDKDLPLYEYQIEIDGQYALEVRGIWEINNDFVGGPFASYLLHNKEQGELLFISSFIFAPGKDKRDFMQEMEYLVKSIKFKKSQ